MALRPSKTPSNEHTRRVEVKFDPEGKVGLNLIPTAFRKKKVAAYARVSTEQDAQQNSYAAQIDYYTGYIQSKPEWEFVGVYADEGISGTSYKNRDGFNKMVADAKAGKIDLILTKSISRFARNTVDSLTITRELKSHNVEVYFEKENISSMDAQAELIFTIMSSVAQEESRSISENVRWGHKRSMEAGKVSLAWSSFLGYTKGPDGLPQIVEEEAAVVRNIYKWFLDGMNYHEIAQRLTNEGVKTPMGKDVWRPESIRSILTNEKYKGDAILQKTYVEDFLTKKVVVNHGQRKQWYIHDSHDAIIPSVSFDLVQQEIARRCARKGRYYNSPFANMIFCGECGAYYGHRDLHPSRKTSQVGWSCINKYKKGVGCKSRFLKEEELETSFIIACNRIFSRKTHVIEEYEHFLLPDLLDTSELDEQVNSASAELESAILEAEQLIAESARQAKNPEMYREKINEVDIRIKKLKAEINDKELAIQDRQLRGEKIRIYLDGIKRVGSTLEKFDVRTWYALTESVRVMPNNYLIFKFKDGTEETVSPEDRN